jgi:hypothetical protein
MINAFPKLFNVFTPFNAPSSGFHFIEKNCNPPPADQNYLLNHRLQYYIVVHTSRTVSTHKQLIFILSQLCSKK